MRLLLVEDDTMIGEVVLDLLRAEHYAVDWVKDGEMADTALMQNQNYDLVVLDLGLPRKDGLEVLRAMRARKDRTPVLVATARDVDELMFERIFTPLGITRKDLAWRDNGYRPKQIEGIPRREFGSGIRANVDAMARVGLLYLRGGVWDGEQLLPAGWVDYSRMPSPNAEGRYAAQWWLDPDRPDLFYASGFNGQSINVVPAKDLVIVVLSESPAGNDEPVREALLDAFGVDRAS